MEDDRSELMSARALSHGHEILWYTIESVLGQGGFGITYLAHDQNLDRSVAIKEYLPTSFAYRRTDFSVKPITGEHRYGFAWGLDSFQKEAQTLARFSHPNIVRVNSVFQANNTAYMVMEYEHGQSLSAVYKKSDSRKDQRFFEQIFFPIFDGLKEIHKFDFIHRDIKPANIYIREDRTPVLIDFGSARQMSKQQNSEMTSLISHGYTPLEQYSASYGEQGPWTDIYALAATIYEGIVGKKPDESLSRSAFLMRGKPDLMVPLSERDYPAFTQRFLDAVDSGLKLEPEGRPQSMEAWADQFTTNNETDYNWSSDSDFTAVESDKTRKRSASYAGKGDNSSSGNNHYDQIQLKADQTPDDELLNFSDPPVSVNAQAMRSIGTANKNTRRKKSKGSVFLLLGALTLALLSIGSGYMYYLSRPSSNNMPVTALNKMPKPPQAIITTMPRDNAMQQLNYLADMAPLLSQAYEINNTDAELLENIRKAEASLFSLAKTWNATRYVDLAKKIESVSNAMPAAVHDQDRIRGILAASDQVQAYDQIIAFLDNKSYLRPSGDSVLDTISSANASDFQRIKATAQWQTMMSELYQAAMEKLARSEFDNVAKLTEAALSLDADHPGFNALQQFLAGT